MKSNILFVEIFIRSEYIMADMNESVFFIQPVLKFLLISRIRSFIYFTFSYGGNGHEGEAGAKGNH